MPYLSSQGRASLSVVSLTGAAEPPSPVTSEVMPWRTLDSAALSASSVISDWPSMSMNPGATTWSAASMRRRAAARERSPTATTRSPARPTSARNQGAPVPSTTRPPAMTRSSGLAVGAGPSGGTLGRASGGASACRAASAPSAIPPAASVNRTLFIVGTSLED